MTKLTRLHFVLDLELFNKLDNESKRRNITISELIEIIWKNSKYLVEKFNFINSELKDESFNEKFLCMTEKLRITINPEFKRQLFLIQGHFFLRSKAEILRHILRMFFAMIEKLGEFAFLVCKEAFVKIWEQEKRVKEEFWKVIYDDMDMKSPPYITCTYNSRLKLTKITYINIPELTP